MDLLTHMMKGLGTFGGAKFDDDTPKLLVDRMNELFEDWCSQEKIDPKGWSFAVQVVGKRVNLHAVREGDDEVYDLGSVEELIRGKPGRDG